MRRPARHGPRQGLSQPLRPGQRARPAAARPRRGRRRFCADRSLIAGAAMLCEGRCTFPHRHAQPSPPAVAAMLCAARRTFPYRLAQPSPPAGASSCLRASANQGRRIGRIGRVSGIPERLPFGIAQRQRREESAPSGRISPGRRARTEPSRSRTCCRCSVVIIVGQPRGVKQGMGGPARWVCVHRAGVGRRATESPRQLWIRYFGYAPRDQSARPRNERGFRKRAGGRASEPRRPPGVRRRGDARPQPPGSAAGAETAPRRQLHCYSLYAPRVQYPPTPMKGGIFEVLASDKLCHDDNIHIAGAGCTDHPSV